MKRLIILFFVHLINTSNISIASDPLKYQMEKEENNPALNMSTIKVSSEEDSSYLSFKEISEETDSYVSSENDFENIISDSSTQERQLTALRKNHIEEEGKINLETLTVNTTTEERELYDFIQKQVIDQESVSEHFLKKMARRIAKIGFITLSSLEGVPGFELAYKAGGGNDIVRWISGISGSVIFSASATWSAFLLTDELNPSPQEEKYFLEKRKIPIPAYIMAHISGFLGAVPVAYIDYKYNEGTPIQWFAFTSLAAAYGFTTNGYLHILRSLPSYFYNCKKTELTEQEKDIFDQQQRLTQHLKNETLQGFLNLSQKDRKDFLTKLYDSQEELTLDRYLNKIFQINNPQNVTPDNWKNGYPKKVIVNGLSLLGLLNVVNAGYYAYEGWAIVTEENVPASVTLAVLGAVPLCALEIHTIQGATSQIFDWAFYIGKRLKYPNLVYSLYPHSYKMMALTSLSLGVVYGNIGLFMGEDSLGKFLPEEAVHFFSAVNCYNLFFFGAYSSFTLLEDTALMFSEYMGSDYIKKTIRFVKSIGYLRNIISSTKVEKLYNFFSNISLNSIFKNFSNKEDTKSYEESFES